MIHSVNHTPWNSMVKDTDRSTVRQTMKHVRPRNGHKTNDTHTQFIGPEIYNKYVTAVDCMCQSWKCDSHRLKNYK